MELGDADHDGVDRRGAPAGDGLQGGNDLRADHHGVDAELRHGGVGALAGHHDLEDVEGGHGGAAAQCHRAGRDARSEEHTSELQSLMSISYAVFCLKKKKHTKVQQTSYI